MTTNNAVNTTLAGQTGTGNFVGATSPTIVTPSIAQINNAAHNLPVILLLGPASSVNSFQMFPSATGNPVQLIAGGTDPNISMVIAGTGTGGIALHGYADASSAAAGYVGEIISSTKLQASQVAITSATPADMTSISLTAGDWDVWGNIIILMGGAGTLTVARAWISTTSATQPDPALYNGVTGIASTVLWGVIAPSIPINVSTTTTVYISTNCSFTGTAGACGSIYARRRR